MRLIFRLNGWLVRILCVLAVLVIAVMAVGVSAEVILRIFRFPSIVGLIELTEYGLFISTFFAAPHLLRTNEHIRVDIAMSRADPTTARRVEYLVLISIIGVSILTGFVGSVILVNNIRAGTLIFKDLIIPQWWLDWIIPLTSVAMALQALEMLVASITASRAVVSHVSSEHVPGIRPEEMP
jgi:TRAP-type C4-dicarboxylate transport system permease small subunit